MVAGARNVPINTARYCTVKVEFRTIGKARWPFGWEILRQLTYPDGYWSHQQRQQPDKTTEAEVPNTSGQPAEASAVVAA